MLELENSIDFFRNEDEDYFSVEIKPDGIHFGDYHIVDKHEIDPKVYDGEEVFFLNCGNGGRPFDDVFHIFIDAIWGVGIQLALEDKNHQEHIIRIPAFSRYRGFDLGNLVLEVYHQKTLIGRLNINEALWEV